jgi:hypothetical protein
MSGPYAASVSDLSTHGCFLETGGQPAPGEVISFEVLLPTERWMRLQGRVIYSDSSSVGFGIEFTNLSDATREFLIDVVDYYAARNV